MSAWKGGLQTLLDDFFATLNGTLERVVTKSALSQARRKLKSSAFTALNERLLSSRAKHLSEPIWNGFRLVAGDSTTLRVPPNSENRDKFGVQHDQSGHPYVLARVFGLYATASKLMLKALVTPYKDDERSLLVKALPSLSDTDLLLLDRGFPAVWLFALLKQLAIPFLMRIDQTGWKMVESFVRSGKTDGIFTWKISQATQKRALEQGYTLTSGTVSVRLIRVILSNGRIEVLATSLEDSTKYPVSEFAELYHQRWQIEEVFKVLKHRLMVEQFSGESPECIHQDVQAKLLVANIAATMAYSAQESLPEQKRKRYQVNFTYAISIIKNHLSIWLTIQTCVRSIGTCLSLFARTLEMVRPGRSAPRPATKLPVKPRRAYK
jgi:hypothetical protein